MQNNIEMTDPYYPRNPAGNHTSYFNACLCFIVHCIGRLLWLAQNIYTSFMNLWRQSFPVNIVFVVLRHVFVYSPTLLLLIAKNFPAAIITSCVYYCVFNSSAGFRSTTVKLRQVVSTGRAYLVFIRPGPHERSHHWAAYTILWVTNFHRNAF